MTGACGQPARRIPGLTHPVRAVEPRRPGVARREPPQLRTWRPHGADRHVRRNQYRIPYIQPLTSRTGQPIMSHTIHVFARHCRSGRRGEPVLDTHTFDALVRSLASRGTRRTIAAGLLVMGVAALPDRSEAKRRRRRKKKKQKKGKGKEGSSATTTTLAPTCAPTCDGAACGADDGCGGTCLRGTCGDCHSCAQGVCVAVANGTPCDDGDKCTDNTCQGGACTVTNTIFCPQPQNECRLSTCNPATGFCEEHNRQQAWPCTPTDLCLVTNGQCDGQGACLAGPKLCGPTQNCCPDGPYAGACKLKSGQPCSKGSDCCSDTCVGIACW